MNLLLTGGTGFFGKALLRHWLRAVHGGECVPRVTVLSRAPEDFLARYPEFAGLEWLEFLRGDVCDAGSLPQGRRFSHVLHAATDSTAGPQLAPLARFDQIVNGTRNLLDFAVACGAQRFLLTSSGGVYGPQPGNVECIPETYCGMPDPMVATHAYSVAKRMAEHLCALYAERDGLQAVVARCFAFIGEDLPLDAHFAIGNFIADALAGREILVKGDGRAVRSYLDQRDLAIWLLTMLARGEPGRAYNLGSDQAITIAELAGLVADVIDPAVPVRVLGANAEAGNFRNRYVPDITRAKTELGLSVRVSLHEAIALTAGAVRGHAKT